MASSTQCNTFLSAFPPAALSLVDRSGAQTLDGNHRSRKRLKTAVANDVAAAQAGQQRKAPSSVAFAAPFASIASNFDVSAIARAGSGQRRPGSSVPEWEAKRAAQAAPSPVLTALEAQLRGVQVQLAALVTSLRERFSYARLLVAGAMSAVVSRTVLAPLERVKMDMMLKNSAGSAVKTAVQVFEKEGLAGFWKGNALNVLRTAPFKVRQCGLIGIAISWPVMLRGRHYSIYAVLRSTNNVIGQMHCMRSLLRVASWRAK